LWEKSLIFTLKHTKSVKLVSELRALFIKRDQRRLVGFLLHRLQITKHLRLSWWWRFLSWSF